MDILTTSDVVTFFDKAIPDREITPFISKITQNVISQLPQISQHFQLTSYKSIIYPIFIPSIMTLGLLSIEISLVIKIAVLICFIIHILIVTKYGQV